MKKQIHIKAIIVLFLLIGIGGSTPVNGQQIATRTIVDITGRSVTLPAVVERIVTVYPPATAIVFAVDGADHFVGIESLNAQNLMLQKLDPRFKTVTNVGHQFRGVNSEEILALKPDLVIASERNREKTMATCESYFPVVYINVNTIPTLKQSLQIIGQALDKEQRAERLLSYYEQKIHDVTGIAETIPDEEKPRVYMTSHGILKTCTADSIEHTILELAGGKNVAENVTGGLYPEITAEQLISWNPDIIFVNAFCSKSTKQEILTDPRFADINAVKNKNVFYMPDYISCWHIGVPELLLGIEWTLYKLHPERMPFLMEEEVKNFYATFYNIDIPETTVTELLQR